ncbi:F-box/kelch-repeat protein At4g33290-like isoform X2 [Eutrema salsugineum]|uniref:F-box/kelch-repeat protein At4g33290-like isoform X2 n=1 Tax=Eutrema salsugineum TaxID=72664 RepID=UPI000CED6062|nr:F-box/kelch-repeat protein At4g33290-like isoform X2 [Eutrema salsugineum]
MLMDYNLYLKRVVFDNDPSIEPKGKLTCLGEQVRVSQVFHCEGLLLCTLRDDTKVVIWNPYWGQTRWIEPRYSHEIQYGRFKYNYKYALGYVNKKKRSCRSHKILRFIDDNLRAHVPGSDEFWWYEVYDFDYDLWTTLDVTPHWRILFFYHGVTLKGNTYWCASERNSGDEHEYHMICFDFTRERFGPEEKLAVSLQHNEACPNEIEIWITTKIEAENVLWSKFLKMDMGPDFDDIPISKSFIIDEEKKVAMGFYKNYEHSIYNKVNFIGEDGYFRGLDLGVVEDVVKGCVASVCPYVPSSVQIKKSAG